MSTLMVMRARPFVRPWQQVARGVGAQPVRRRRDAHTTQVEPVGIPTGEQRGIAGRVTVGVQPACLVQQVEARRIEMHQRAAQRTGELPAAFPVPTIDVVVHATRIVEQREERDDLPVGPRGLGHPQPVLQHARPVHDLVGAVRRQGMIAEDSLENGRLVVHEARHAESFGRRSVYCALRR
jgi:hypothetical protein